MNQYFIFKQGKNEFFQKMGVLMWKLQLKKGGLPLSKKKISI